MKIQNKKIKSTETYTINYENGILCDVTIVDGVLHSHSFRCKVSKELHRNRLSYITNIEHLQSIHWFDVKKEDVIDTKFTIEELKSFTDFENLYIWGGGNDGTLRTKDGNPLTSLQLIDDIHCKIYNKIWTYDQAKSFKAIADTHPWVKSCKIVDIPYYNRDEDEHQTDSVSVTVFLPQEDYEKVFKATGATYFDDRCKTYIIEQIKKS